jgi:T-complex protein 1 subunit beta
VSCLGRLKFRMKVVIDDGDRVDMNEGSIGSMRKLGITESYKLKRQVVLSASEAAEMIIRQVHRLISCPIEN